MSLQPRCKRGRWALAAFSAVVFLILAGLAWLLLSSSQPLYRGKPLTAWLELSLAGSPVERRQAEEAVRQAGTNALPGLLRLLRAHDSKGVIRLVNLANQKQQLVHVPYTSAVKRGHLAIEGFRLLGNSARDAVPTLILIFDQRKSSQYATAAALGWIGPAAVHAVPSLVGAALTNSNNEVRCISIVALGQIHAEPDLTVPALVKLLGDWQVSIRKQAVYSLMAFGREARRAIPALLELLEDQDNSLRQAAADGLKCISPEATAGAAVK